MLPFTSGLTPELWSSAQPVSHPPTHIVCGWRVALNKMCVTSWLCFPSEVYKDVDISVFAVVSSYVPLALQRAYVFHVLLQTEARVAMHPATQHVYVVSFRFGLPGRPDRCKAN
jgi:hypothetical protein